MYKILFGLAFTAIVVNSASAQDYRRNWVECARELGWQPERIQNLSDGRKLSMWRWHNEAQQAAHNDCIARKARQGAKPSGNARQRTSQ
jgi:hypothetical protein